MAAANPGRSYLRVPAGGDRFHAQERIGQFG